MQLNPILNASNKLSLGAFDEITSVSGTTYTIKRQTGYCNYGRSIMALYQDGNKNMQYSSTGGGYRWGTDYHSILPDEVVNIILYQRDSSGVVQSTPDAIIHSPIKFYLTDGNANWSRGDLNSLSDHFCSLNANGITSFDDYWNFFRFNEVIIEYKAASSYTETITL